ncbi:hypothetical protein MCEMRE249_00156 [Candidatus Nanopelagicaceae bacterium]|jgi:hypothetical protein|uniref:Unannotated protein n=1 Tax=freshwater metagenome TaxID=449393 RepID=A0A6J7AA97_9ZZZZ|nr:hypothetical protein [Actinomycetota bacterium]
MKHDIREFFTALSALRISRSGKVALWATVGSMLFIATAQQSAYGLDFPMTTRLTLADSKNLTVATSTDAASLSAAISEMALVANISAQVEMARSIVGAKKVTKTIMSSEFSWGDDEYSCLNRLWTKESHWNYKAHNYRSGAHGIPQALPAVKMEVISSDWRTNPVTQIRWGLRYIDIRYETPCQAWAKFKRSRYY